MNFKQVGFALVLLLILAALFGAWATRSGSVAPTTTQQHVLAGEQIGEGNMYLYGENKDYYTVEVYYPGSTELVGVADVKARMTIEQSLADRIAEFKKNSNLESLTAEDIQIQGLGGDRKYTLEMQYKSYASEGTVSYLYTIYEDTLGAHPNAYYLTFVFDKNGNEVSLAQLFPNNPNWLEELSLLVSKDVTAQMKTRTGQSDVTTSLFAEGLAPKVENFSNFVLDNGTLVVMLPPYQVAAYAAGSFEVRIPLKDLQ